MRLRSAKLGLAVARVLPFEILSMIISESDSPAALATWCLVSFESLRVAGPQLLEEVILDAAWKIMAFFYRIVRLTSSLVKWFSSSFC